MVARNVCGERREGRERREASAGRSGASDRTARRARKKNVGQRTHDHLMQVFNVPWSVPGGEYHSLLRKARSHSSSEGLENREKRSIDVGVSVRSTACAMEVGLDRRPTYLDSPLSDQIALVHYDYALGDQRGVAFQRRAEGAA